MTSSQHPVPSAQRPVPSAQHPAPSPQRPAPVDCCVRVHGSTSNLGSGFDVVGVALDIDLTLEVIEVGPGAGETTWEFVGATLSGENALARAYAAGLAAWGAVRPAMRVRVESAIPMRAGLGSSAAAIVAGLRLAARVTGMDDEGAILDMATRLEGHPDNVAASLLGGCVVSAVDDEGHVMARRLAWPETWRVVVATPSRALETRHARAVLPPQVPRADAIFNLQRVALLVHAIGTGDGEALGEAVRDRLHQPQRAPLVAGLAEIIDRGVDGALAVFLSGAGPSLAAIAEAGETARVERAFASLFASLGDGVDVRTLRVVQ